MSGRDNHRPKNASNRNHILGITLLSFLDYDGGTYRSTPARSTHQSSAAPDSQWSAAAFAMTNACDGPSPAAMAQQAGLNSERKIRRGATETREDGLSQNNILYDRENGNEKCPIIAYNVCIIRIDLEKPRGTAFYCCMYVCTYIHALLYTQDSPIRPSPCPHCCMSSLRLSSLLSFKLLRHTAVSTRIRTHLFPYPFPSLLQHRSNPPVLLIAYQVSRLPAEWLASNGPRSRQGQDSKFGFARYWPVLEATSIFRSGSPPA